MEENENSNICCHRYNMGRTQYGMCSIKAACMCRGDLGSMHCGSMVL